MKTSMKPAKVERLGNFAESQFGISNSEDLVYIFDILRNKLYSDKITAVIREYSTNAMDSHVESGKPDLPIEITLPTAFSPEFKVRDFGQGLSEEDIRNVYCMYGRSTKRNSNNYTGQLGLGSKSGFAYGENFLVTSYHNGLKITYNAYIDETRIGSLAKMSQETAGPSETGIEICIPVERGDYHRFESKALETLKYFKVLPKMIDRKDFFENSERDIAFEAKTWRMTDSDNSYSYRGEKSVAIMGNIGYPIAYHSNEFSEEISDILAMGLEIDFDIGTLNIGANRESLEYDKYTQANITKKCESISAEFLAIVNAKLDQCKTAIEARRIVNSTFNNRRAQKIFGKKPIIWNGINVSEKHIGNQGFPNIGFTRVYLRGDNMKREITDSIYIDKDDAYFLKDTSDGWVIRSKAYLKNNPLVNNLYIIDDNRKVELSHVATSSTSPLMTAPKIGTIEQWMKLTGFTNTDIIKLSTVDKPPPIRKTSNGKARAKDVAKAFTLSKSTSHWGTQGENWEETSIDKTGKGIYVGLYRFEISKGGGNICRARSLSETIKLLKTLGFDYEKNPVYGIKESEIPKLGDGWITLNDYVLNQFKKSKKLKKALQSVYIDKNITRAMSRCDYYEVLKDLFHQDNIREKLKDTLCCELMEYAKDTITKKDKDKLQDIIEISKKFSLGDAIDAKSAEEKVKSLIKDIDVRYPLLRFIDHYGAKYCYDKDERKRKKETFRNAVMTYIVLVDKENSENKGE